MHDITFARWSESDLGSDQDENSVAGRIRKTWKVSCRDCVNSEQKGEHDVRPCSEVSLPKTDYGVTVSRRSVVTVWEVDNQNADILFCQTGFLLPLANTCSLKYSKM